MATIKEIADYANEFVAAGLGDWDAAVCLRGLPRKTNESLVLYPGDDYAALNPMKRIVYFTARIKEH